MIAIHAGALEYTGPRSLLEGPWLVIICSFLPESDLKSLCKALPTKDVLIAATHSIKTLVAEDAPVRQLLLPPIAWAKFLNATELVLRLPPKPASESCEQQAQATINNVPHGRLTKLSIQGGGCSRQFGRLLLLIRRRQQQLRELHIAASHDINAMSLTMIMRLPRLERLIVPRWQCSAPALQVLATHCSLRTIHLAKLSIAVAGPCKPVRSKVTELVLSEFLEVRLHSAPSSLPSGMQQLWEAEDAEEQQEAAQHGEPRHEELQQHGQQQAAAVDEAGSGSDTPDEEKQEGQEGQEQGQAVGSAHGCLARLLPKLQRLSMQRMGCLWPIFDIFNALKAHPRLEELQLHQGPGYERIIMQGVHPQQGWCLSTAQGWHGQLQLSSCPQLRKADLQLHAGGSDS